MKTILLIIVGYALIYATIEGTIRLTGNPLETGNAIVVCICTVIVAIAVEMFMFKQSFLKSVLSLGFGKSSFRAILVSIFISGLLFCCYPLITFVTGYKFILPTDWLWLSIGVFALHGIAEEAAFRGFLFHHLRQGRSFIKAVWLSIFFFAIAHVPVMINQGIIIGGTATFLAIAISFPFAFLFEKGNNTIWAPAIIHFAVDTVIPILAFDNSNHTNRQIAILLWMAVSIILPYFVFAFFRKKSIIH